MILKLLTLGLSAHTIRRRSRKRTSVKFALVIGQGEGSTVLDQLQKPGGSVLGDHAGGAAAEGRQVPGVARLDGRAAGGRETHAREVCGWERDGV